MRMAWYIGFVLAVLLIIIQGVNSEMSDRTIKTMRGKLSDAEVYGRVAIINFEGSKSLSKDYSLPDSLTGWNSGYFKRKAGKVFVRYDDEAIARYREMISRDPVYPFGHHMMAEALYLKKDPLWIDYALRAAEILEKTTAIVNHSPDHDDALRNIRELLRKEAEKRGEPDGAANGSQPIRSETNRTSAASVEVQLFANVDGVHPHETPAAAVWLPGEEY
jgi:hypothetical protein